MENIPIFCHKLLFEYSKLQWFIVRCVYALWKQYSKYLELTEYALCLLKIAIYMSLKGNKSSNDVVLGKCVIIRFFYICSILEYACLIVSQATFVLTKLLFLCNRTRNSCSKLYRLCKLLWTYKDRFTWYGNFKHNVADFKKIWVPFLRTFSSYIFKS